MAWRSGLAYSQALRERVLAAADGGRPVREVAPLFRISVSPVYKALGRRAATGDVAARRGGGRRPPKLAGHEEALLAYVRAVASGRDAGRAAGLAPRGAGRRRQHRLPLERTRAARLDAQKKSQRAAEQDRPDVAAARADWRAAQPGLNPKRLVFLDESGFATNMSRRHGRSPRGRRLAAPVPHGRWTTSTLVAGLRHDGIVAPLVVDHPMNGATLRAYVERFLAPALSPSDIVVCDNLGCHKAPGVRAAIEARGAELRHLPAYSPDLNPIERAFAKLKALVRAWAPRTVGDLWDSIGDCLGRFAPPECANYLANSGYPRLM